MEEQRIEVTAPMAEYYEMELDGVAYKLRPTLAFLRRQDEFRESLEQMTAMDHAKIEGLLRPAMRHYHTDEEIDTFLDTATVPQAVRLMTGRLPDENVPEDFPMPPTTGEKTAGTFGSDYGP